MGIFDNKNSTAGGKLQDFGSNTLALLKSTAASAGASVAIESFAGNASDEAMQAAHHSYNSVGQILSQAINESGISLESFGSSRSEFTSVSDSLAGVYDRRRQEVAMESASIIAMIADNPTAYRHSFKESLEAFQNTPVKNLVMNVNYANGERAAACGILSQNDAYALEGFEDQNLKGALAYSLAYNLIAPVQEPMIEALFPTIVCTPGQVGFMYEVMVDKFYNGYMHLSNDNVKRNLEKHLLMDAIRRPKILRQDVLNVIPHYIDVGANANTDLFMPATVKQPELREIAGHLVKTQPLLVGQEYDLIAMSRHEGLLGGGIFDETDVLDSALAIENIYLSVGNDQNVVKLSTAGLETRNFNQALQGHQFDMDLKFRNDEFIVDERMKNLSGAEIAAVKAFVDAGYKARLTISVNGDANTESGYFKITHAEAKITEVQKLNNATGKYEIVSLNDATVKSEVAKLKFEVKYYDPYACRTNRNFRTQGYLLDTDSYHARFTFGVRSPFRIQHPVGSDKSFPAVEKLITATRIRQSADAFYELFNFRDTLKRASADNMEKGYRTAGFIGVAKLLNVNLFYEHIEYDLTEVIKSAETKDNLENAREGLVSLLQEVAARCVIDSNYMIASTYLNNGKQETPHFVIACGQYLPLLLSVKGDLRLLGANFDHTIVTSFNEVMDNKIFMTLTRPKVTGFDPLTFGNTFWYPELVTTIDPKQINGAYNKTTMISTRYQHVPNLPILIEVDVKGVKEFMTTYNKYRVDAVVENKTASAAAPAAPGPSAP